MTTAFPHRIRLRIVGQSGSGLNSVGIILARALRDLGLFVVTDREYPSLIIGGHSNFTINFSPQPIHGLSNEADVMLALDKPCLVTYKNTLKDGGMLVHGYERMWGIKKILAELEERSIQIIHAPAETIVEKNRGKFFMTNVVLIGMVWKTLGFPLEKIEAAIKTQFSKRPQLLETNLQCLRDGYDQVASDDTIQNSKFKIQNFGENNTKKIILDGNHAIALGAVAGGMQAYFAYPMSPASSILSYLAVMAPESGILVKQIEDEISVANMTLGAAHAGTRAMTATSGGGFDLMTETVSLSGIIETPLVIVIAQRPGPATGLPTWTGQGDLLLAVHSGHGEFGRAVMTVSDANDAFYRTQEAFNIAEKYQIPVVLLTEKFIAESHKTVEPFDGDRIPMERGLPDESELENLKKEDRYALTESGISTRWIPGSSPAYYFANGDEHGPDGRLDESENAGDMIDKRCRKRETMKQEFPDPEIYGKETADISFVGWGSTKSVMLDVIEYFAEKNVAVNYLHYTYLWPLKTDLYEKFREKNPNLHLIEGNHDGQLGKLLASEGATKIAEKNQLLKWNGRPFFLEDVIAYIEEHSNMKAVD